MVESDVHKLSPEVISHTKLACFEYKKGFKKPSVGLPALARTEFTKDIIPATTGVEADVPDRIAKELFKTTA